MLNFQRDLRTFLRVFINSKRVLREDQEISSLKRPEISFAALSRWEKSPAQSSNRKIFRQRNFVIIEIQTFKHHNTRLFSHHGKNVPDVLNPTTLTILRLISHHGENFLRGFTHIANSHLPNTSNGILNLSWRIH